MSIPLSWLYTHINITIILIDCVVLKRIGIRCVILFVGATTTQLLRTGN